MTHHFDEVKGLGKHDNAGHVFLPNHSPEISNCRLQWTLADNVSIRLEQTLKQGVD
jgi:hypothetical protein